MFLLILSKHIRGVLLNIYVSSLLACLIMQSNTLKGGGELNTNQPYFDDSERWPQHNALGQKPSTAPHAKRNIADGIFISAWKVLFHEQMLRNIRRLKHAKYYLMKIGMFQMKTSMLIQASHMCEGILAQKKTISRQFMVKILGSATMPRDRFKEI